MPLTDDLENFFSNFHSHVEYLRQLSSKSIHEVQSHRVTRVVLTDKRRANRQ